MKSQTAPLALENDPTPIFMGGGGEDTMYAYIKFHFQNIN